MLRKLIWITGFIAALAVPVYAQQQEFTFKINGEEINLIGKALDSQPFGQVAPLIKKLQEQFAAQQPKPNATGKVENNSGVVTQGQKGDNTVNGTPVPKPAPEVKE
jgi:hypothetical protein